MYPGMMNGVDLFYSIVFMTVELSSLKIGKTSGCKTEKLKKKIGILLKWFDEN